MPIPRSLLTLTAVLLLTSAVGCAGDPAAPSSRMATLSGRSSSLKRARGTPNTVKYRDSGVKPGFGRSGNASVEARALIGRDRGTLLEVSTGSLEAGTSTGSIAKVQVKTSGAAAATRNFNGLTNGGYWSTPLAGLDRGTPLQLQANVKGIDVGTDVVDVATRVVRRPDLVVHSVSGPTMLAPHAFITISAMVLELNGDVGARANCVLSVDGVEADRANGIWVDAAGAVSCMFAHRFDDVGSHDVSVSATDVNPGDWDASNNTAHTTVTVRSVESGPIQIEFMQADQGDLEASSHWTNTDGPNPADATGGQVWHWSQAVFNGWDMFPVGVPLARTDVSITENGVEQYSASLVPNTTAIWRDEGDNYQKCTIYETTHYEGDNSISDGNYMGICDVGLYSDPSAEWRMYWYTRNQGQVTFFGSGFYCYPDTGCQDATFNYYWLFNTATSYGWQVGSRIGLRVSFVGTDGSVRSASQEVTLADVTAPFEYHDCYADEWLGGTTCVDGTGSGHWLSANIFEYH